MRTRNWRTPSVMAAMLIGGICAASLLGQGPMPPPDPSPPNAPIVPPRGAQQNPGSNPEPVIPPSPPVAPPAASPLNLLIDWPGAQVAGELVIISAARSTGLHSVDWSIKPGNFRTRWDSAALELTFSTHKPGIYSFHVCAADQFGNQVSQDHDIELIAPADSPQPQTAIASRGRVDYGSTLKALIAAVSSGSKASDAARLADDFRNVSSLVRTNKVTDRGGMERATLELAKHDLGLALDDWGPMFKGLDKMLDGEGNMSLDRLLQVWSAAASELESVK